MSTSVSIPATVQIKRGRLFGLVAVVAVLAAAVTWAVLTFAVNSGSSTTQAAAPNVASSPLTPAEQSLGSYLFGRTDGLTRAELQAIRDYRVGARLPLAHIPLTSAEQSVGSYLFGRTDGLTPAQLQTIREYQVGAVSPLKPSERSIGFYLFGRSTGLTPAQTETIRSYEAGAR